MLLEEKLQPALYIRSYLSINRILQMMIDQAIAETLTTYQETESPLQEDHFTLYLNEQQYDNARCLLYPHHIILHIKKNLQEVLKVRFDYELIFQLLREEEPNKKLGKPIGIRFERQQQTLELRTEAIPSLLAWRDLLAGTLKQRGFHQLFKPIKKIGKGNFATVYLVYKYEDSKKYAVKAFSKESAYSEQFGKESLINQIEIMRMFSHKNLMKLTEVFESQNSIYISVELLQGGQLYDKLKAKHKFTQLQTKTVMKGILQGLEVMHEKGIMHRDLKPENILMRTEGDFDCVVADFGLAQNCKEDYMFVRCGTPGYVAPEVANLRDMKAKYSPICDLFSVGVIFHMLVLRKSPFPGKEYDQVLSQNRHCNINFQHAMYQTMPPMWLNLLKRLLQKDPLKRISATEALNHEFFSKDEMFKQFVEMRKSTLIMDECNSPLMLTKNVQRKKKVMLRDDSCLKFKMKENVLTGRTDESGQMIDEINSPAAIKTKAVKINQSRFKRGNNS